MHVDKIVWIDGYDEIEALEKMLPQTKKNRSTRAEVMTAEEAALYKNLWEYEEVLVPVVVRGEFQTSSGNAFGNLAGFRHRLILYRVLELGKPEELKLQDTRTGKTIYFDGTKTAVLTKQGKLVFKRNFGMGYTLNKIRSGEWKRVEDN